MKLVALFLIVFGLASCEKESEPEREYSWPKDAEFLPDNALVVTFAVEGMTCGGCEYNVTSALRHVEGTLRAEADHRRGEATVTFDPILIEVDDLVAAVADAGYASRRPENDPRPASPPTPEEESER